MINKILTALLLMTLSGCILQLSKRPDENLDQQVVRENFNAYKYALLNDLGSDASDLVSARTIHYYEQLLALALTGDEKALKNLPGFDRMVVLSMRHNIPAEELVAITAKELFAFGVQDEWITKQNIAPYELGDIGVFGNYATANIRRGENNTERYLEFRKENGVWRLNLTPLIDESKQQFALKLSQLQGDENQAIVDLIESMSGNKVSKTIWNPILKPAKSAEEK